MNCTGTFTKYIYDGNGTLVKRVVTSKPTTSGAAAETTTVYIGGVYEKTTVGSTTTVTKYYQAFGRAIAMRQGSTLYFLLADHLGSTVGMLEADGDLYSSQKYWAYGAVRAGGITTTDKLYTGQQKESGDPSLGLYNYKARFYSTATGRFVSADSIVQGAPRAGSRVPGRGVSNRSTG